MNEKQGGGVPSMWHRAKSGTGARVVSSGSGKLIVDPLVSTEWLARRLSSPTLRIFDTAVAYDATGELVSGRDRYENGHIPGAGFLDLIGDLSDPVAEVILMRPEPESLAEALGEAGIGDSSEVVLYSSDHLMWATRVWWMLHGLGFGAKAVLDGGLAAWVREGRPIESGPVEYAAAQITVRPRPHVWLDKDGVRAALDRSDTSIVCALRPEVYAGHSEEHYGRPGHIAGSVNVPHTAAVDPDANTFRSLHEIREAFARDSVLDKERVITYCGGGIAATVDAFALFLLGHEDVSVYDGSLLEWSRDPNAPMITRPRP